MDAIGELQEIVRVQQEEIRDLQEQNAKLVNALKWLSHEVTELWIEDQASKRGIHSKEEMQEIREDRYEALRRLLEG
jgi:hypothetical protein